MDRLDGVTSVGLIYIRYLIIEYMLRYNFLSCANLVVTERIEEICQGFRSVIQDCDTSLKILIIPLVIQRIYLSLQLLGVVNRIVKYKVYYGSTYMILGRSTIHYFCFPNTLFRHIFQQIIQLVFIHIGFLSIDQDSHVICPYQLKSTLLYMNPRKFQYGIIDASCHFVC